MHIRQIVFITLAISAVCPVLLFLMTFRHNQLPFSFNHTRTKISARIPLTTDSCRRKRYQEINSMNLTENDFIPYTCHNYRNHFITVLGMALNPFNKTKLKFYVNGSRIRKYSLRHAHRTFAINAPLNKTKHLMSREEQVFTYAIDGCSFSMTCDNYHPKQTDQLNLCVYTKHNATILKPFLDYYHNFADRIFIYNNRRENDESFAALKSNPKKHRVVPWYLEDLRDLQISSKVYDELVAHNTRNYSRDAQKVQTNDCMFRNRETDLVLMIDDDEYLNYHDRSFYRSLHGELKDRYDDILVFRNFCTDVAETEKRISVVFNTTTVYCKEASRKRLEKAFVLPANCPLYEIHRCTRQRSFRMKHLNIYLTHKSYRD